MNPHLTATDLITRTAINSVHEKNVLWPDETKVEQLEILSGTYDATSKHNSSGEV